MSERGLAKSGASYAYSQGACLRDQGDDLSSGHYSNSPELRAEFEAGWRDEDAAIKAGERLWTKRAEEMGENMIGWFGAADQAEPEFDPKPVCLYCGDLSTPDDVLKHSFMTSSATGRSYFYRTHRTCDDFASQREKDLVIEAAIRRVNGLECGGVV